MLELAILGLLKEQQLHGYELKKRLSDTLGLLWGVSFGSLYPALRRSSGRRRSRSRSTRSSARVRADPATGSIDGEPRGRLAPSPGPKPTAPHPQGVPASPPRASSCFAELLAGRGRARRRRRAAFALKLAFCRHLARDARLALLERRRAGSPSASPSAAGSTAGRSDRYSRSLVEHRTESTERDLAWVERAHRSRTTCRSEPEPSQEGATA